MTESRISIKADAKASAKAGASGDTVLARRLFALEVSRAYWRRRGPVASVTMDVALAARIDGFLCEVWMDSEQPGARNAARAALARAARTVRNENSLVPVARFLAGAWGNERKAALAALNYAMNLVRDDGANLLPAAREALAFLTGRAPLKTAAPQTAAPQTSAPKTGAPAPAPQNPPQTPNKEPTP